MKGREYMAQLGKGPFVRQACLLQYHSRLTGVYPL